MCVADDSSVGEADDARSMFEQTLVVGGEDKGETEAAVQIAHQVDELCGIAGVEVGGGLIGEHKRRAMHDGTSDGDALAFSAREQVGPLLRAGGEADVGEGFGDTSTAFAGIEALDEKGILDVFGGREDRNQIEGLEDEADSFAAKGRGLRGTQARSLCRR